MCDAKKAHEASLQKICFLCGSLSVTVNCELYFLIGLFWPSCKYVASHNDHINTYTDCVSLKNHRWQFDQAYSLWPISLFNRSNLFSVFIFFFLLRFSHYKVTRMRNVYNNIVLYWCLKTVNCHRFLTLSFLRY